MTAAALTALTSIFLTVVTVALIAIANWPGGSPRRPLGGTRELTPFERL